jgi:hypothetical protein
VARYQILFWRDIPSLVKAFADDGASTSRQLDDWYQQEIDREAMRLGLVGSDAYLEGWHWGDEEERPGNPTEVLAAVAGELDVAFAARRSGRG